MRRDFPKHIHQTAVYSRDDGNVDWKTCINNGPETDVEVKGTHMDMAWNAAVYRVTGEHLADVSVKGEG
jgi:hypothetical protein